MAQKREQPTRFDSSEGVGSARSWILAGIALSVRVQRGAWRAALLGLTALHLGCQPIASAEGPVASFRVSGISRLVAGRLVVVSTSSVAVTTTPEHPFAKMGAGWTRAADLLRGDEIETASGGSATVIAAEAREVPPTAVYNLTVSKTHAYFVGAQALLVHNTDCGGTPAAGGGRKRAREEGPSQEREHFEARRAQRKAELTERWRARERAREQHRMSVDPFNDMPGRPNCVYCSLGGLSDVDKVSTLIRQHNIDVSDPNQMLTYPQMDKLMRELGLRHEDTPPLQKFPGSSAERREARNRARDEGRKGLPRPEFPFQKQAKEFMANSSANTFVVVFFELFHGVHHNAHAVLAVRRDDGSIVYLDLQTVPPSIYDDLDPRARQVIVTPTAVDWRGNKQLSNVVENGVHAPRPPAPEDLDDFFPESVGSTDSAPASPTAPTGGLD